MTNEQIQYIIDNHVDEFDNIKKVQEKKDLVTGLLIGFSVNDNSFVPIDENNADYLKVVEWLKTNPLIAFDVVKETQLMNKLKIDLALQQISSSISNTLDTKAREFRYDDIKSAKASAGVPLIGTETATELAQHNEALSLAIWDRAVWAKSSEIEALILPDVLAGTIPVPTFDEILPQLPAFVLL